MALRKTPSSLLETSTQNVHGEILAEQAASLGRAGAQMEAALQRLKAFDASQISGDRPALVGAAASAVWAFFVQRDVMGLRDQDQVIAYYDIPGEVLCRVGERIGK
ncbi:MAG TPA: DUF6665 family protein [Rhizomicrobium sp.]|jgi:hypothetical protein